MSTKMFQRILKDHDICIQPKKIIESQVIKELECAELIQSLCKTITSLTNEMNFHSQLV